MTELISKPVILTGIRANNDLHIGNYFGALLPMIDLATKRSDKYSVHLFIPDLHSFTTPIDHKKLHNQIFHNLKIFVASGLPLDNDNIYIYRQSFISAHSELTWILDCFTGFGEMNRMIQFKEKSGSLKSKSEKNDINNDSDRISVGLFNYPVLMAADILLYGAEYVPVGDDQTQHLEFTRDIAERMNAKFSDIYPDGLFTVPRPVQEQHQFFGKDQGLRIRDLQNPSKKMSKSDATGKGIIFMGDDPKVAAQKILTAETDSYNLINYDFEKQPGISNLLEILELFGGNKQTYIGQTSYGELKQDVANKVEKFLRDFHATFSTINESQIEAALIKDESIIRNQANKTLDRVQKAVGLRQ